MNIIFKMTTILTLSISAFAHGKDISCIPRAEMGETTTGEYLYERDDDINISNLSHIDFDKLTISSADGGMAKLEKLEKNVYKTTDEGVPYYFITDNINSIVTELQVKDSATYIKVLLCKKTPRLTR